MKQYFSQLSVWIKGHFYFIFISLGTFFLLASLASILFPVPYNRSTSYGFSRNNPEGGITDGKVIEQPISFDGKTIHEVSVFVSTFARVNRGGLITLQLIQQPDGAILAERQIATEDIQDNANITISLQQPQALDDCVHCITSSGCTATTAITLWFAQVPDNTKVSYSPAVINGIRSNVPLVFSWTETAKRNRGLWELLLLSCICFTSASLFAKSTNQD